MVSVIISVYNVAPYIRKCIESIQNQTCKDVEIIAVDDGSTDESGEICDTMAQEDSRIVVVHKENGGNASARNAGIDCAKGEFIAFVDGDDYIEEDMYESLLREMDNPQVFIAAGGIIITTLDGNEIVSVSKEKHFFSRKEAMFDFFDGRGTIGASACNKLFRKEVFENNRFNNDIIHEDTGLMPKLLDSCEGVAVCNRAFYHYVKRKNSASTSRLYNMRSYRFMDSVAGYRKMCKEKYPELMGCYVKYEARTTYEMLLNLAGCSNYRDFKKQEKHLRSRLFVLTFEELKYRKMFVNEGRHFINYLIPAVLGCSLYNRLFG